MAPPGNQVATEKTNIDLQHRESPVYSTQTQTHGFSMMYLTASGLLAHLSRPTPISSEKSCGYSKCPKATTRPESSIVNSEKSDPEPAECRLYAFSLMTQPHTSGIPSEEDDPQTCRYEDEEAASQE